MKTIQRIVLLAVLLGCTNRLCSQEYSTKESLELRIGRIENDNAVNKELYKRYSHDLIVLKDSFTSSTVKIKEQNDKLEQLSICFEQTQASVDSQINLIRNETKKKWDSNQDSISQTKEIVFSASILIFIVMMCCLLYFIVRQRKLSKMLLSIKSENSKIIEGYLDCNPKLLDSYADIGYKTNVDHTLATKVADEITRIETNLSRMDSSIRGYKQISKSIERIRNNYMANGYEFVELLNKPYDEGMKMNVDFVIDETLPLGTRIITSVSKPQINYNGTLIQKAIVTVSQNI